MTHVAVLPRVLVVLALSCVLAGCGSEDAPLGSGSGGGVQPTAGQSTAPAPTAVQASVATGPAVLIPPGYEPPAEYVDSTGAHLPANGKPTLAFVDAIW